MTAERERIAVLDGLRALAIMLVLARHGLRPFWTNLAHPFLPLGGFDFAPLLLNGWIGVDLFFVLSGFLITTYLLEKLPGAVSRAAVIGTYMKRRFFRIAPAYYVVLTVTCAGALLMPGADEVPDVTAWSYIYHLLFLNDYFPSNINVVFWSLAIEAKFYLVAPLLALLLLRLKTPLRYIIVLAAAIMILIAARYATAAALQSDWEQYPVYFADVRNRFHLTLDGLLAGMLGAALWRDAGARGILQRRAVANILFFAGAALLMVQAGFTPMLDNGVTMFDAAVQPALLATGWLAVMLGLLGGCAGNRIFAGKGLRFIALVSYSLYLVHMALLQPAAVMAQNMFGLQGGPALWVMTMAVWVPLSLAAASMLYYFVERPAINWSRREKVKTP